jgi:hypothetical protein
VNAFTFSELRPSIIHSTTTTEKAEEIHQTHHKRYGTGILTAGEKEAELVLVHGA